MKKKAIIKTIIDVMKFVGALFGSIVGVVLALYLFLQIPMWILNSIGITKDFADIHDTVFMIMIYYIEFVILVALGIAVWFIRAIYLDHLESLYDTASVKCISTSISCVSGKDELSFSQIKDAECFYYNNTLYMKISQQDLQERGIESVNAISIINACFMHFDKDTIVSSSTKDWAVKDYVEFYIPE